MITIKNPKQKELLDPWYKIGKKRRDVLENSWAGLFKKEILPELPVKELSEHFEEHRGRPSKELYTIIGVLILQQMHDMTDNETFFNILFNNQWHYALNIVSETDDAKYISLKTIWSMRQLIIKKNLDKIIFDRIALKLKKVFSVDFSKQRLDSVHIKSNMKKIGRIRIFATTINKFLINLKRKNVALYEQVDEDIRDEYTSAESMQCFAMVRPSDSSNTLNALSKDLHTLVKQFKDNEEIKNMFTYKNMVRVLQEQCIVTETDSVVEVKKPKDIPSDSLQNPSDPDATYSGHKGQGYSTQICETYIKEKDGFVLNLITHVSVEAAHNSDANFTIPVIEDTTSKGLTPDILAADTLYGSDKNFQLASDLGVTLIAPVAGSLDSENHAITDFVFSHGDNGTEDSNCSASSQEIENVDSSDSISEDKKEEGDYDAIEFNDSRSAICPAGHRSCGYKKTKRSHIYSFDSKFCNSCLQRDKCPVKHGKNNHSLIFTDKELRIATRRKLCSSKEFQDEYRYRAGVEATMSQIDRMTGIKHLRVRGINSVRYCATLKALSINIFRATKVQKYINKLKDTNNSTGLNNDFEKIFALISNIIKNYIKTTLFLINYAESSDNGSKCVA